MHVENSSRGPLLVLDEQTKPPLTPLAGALFRLLDRDIDSPTFCQDLEDLGAPPVADDEALLEKMSRHGIVTKTGHCLGGDRRYPIYCVAPKAFVRLSEAKASAAAS